MKSPPSNTSDHQSAPHGVAPARSARAPGSVTDRGAEPSNTAPHKYTLPNPFFLRWAIDSLYLSFRGELAQDWYAKLSELKEKAQSDDQQEQALAQVNIGGHLFAVSDRGTRFYTFVLRDNAFSISISRGKSVPMAYVQIRSEYLAHKELDEIVSDICFVVNTLGKVKVVPQVSRVDLCVDFVPPCQMDGWTQRSWITRARIIRSHYVNHEFTGWSIGDGGQLVCRLYDKFLEVITKSAAVYLFDLWAAAGWDSDQPVFRLEAQFRRGVLDQLGISTVDHLQTNQRGMWRYFSEDWLRLTIPDDSNKNPSRWPTHPLWNKLATVPWGDQDQPKLKRFRKERIPRDERIFPAGLGYISSFMARERIEDWGEGLGEFVHQMRGYMDIVGSKIGKDFGDLLQERIAAKGRLYNTLDNTLKDPNRNAEITAHARAYQKAKDGDDEDNES